MMTPIRIGVVCVDGLWMAYIGESFSRFVTGAGLRYVGVGDCHACAVRDLLTKWGFSHPQFVSKK